MSRFWLLYKVPGQCRVAVLVCAASVSIISMAGCGRNTPGHIHVQKAMTWQCAPESDSPQFPEAQAVRLRFVEDPRYYDVISGRGLCDRLKRSSKDAVMVEFDVWGNASGMVGYLEVALDGEMIKNVGGFGSSNATESGGTHPLARLFK